jgi:beta-galactosidase
MYPALEEIEAFFTDGGPVAAGHHAASRVGPAEAARVRRMPYLMCEYLHAMGTGPGGAREYADLVEKHPGIVGGFVWEWRDHALLRRTSGGEDVLAFGGDFGETIHDGNFVCDGLVLADSTPTSGLTAWSATVAPVRARWAGAEFVVESRYHARSVDPHLRWRVERAGEQWFGGELRIPPLPAGDDTTVPVPDDLLRALDAADASAHEIWLTLDVVSARDEPWARAGWVMYRQQVQLADGRSHRRSVEGLSAEGPAPETVDRPVQGGSDIRLGTARFDARTGELRAVGGMSVTGPVPELWRAPTDNDEGHGPLDYTEHDPRTSGGAGAGRRGPSAADRWRDLGLHRLERRTLAVEQKPTGLVVRYRSAPASLPLAIETTLRYRATAAGLHCHATVVPVGPWTGTWPRVALRLGLPDGARNARWFGAGPGESYPDMMTGVSIGVFEVPVTELLSRTVRPQESGHRSQVRWLELDRDGETAEVRQALLLRSTGNRHLGFTATPWTSQQIAEASHRELLPPSKATWLYLDLAQHGLGSRSCGPDVRPEAALRPASYAVEFTLGTTVH